eukprot:Polyplicarium_translucidae@DN1753_c0_g1_i2.p1
MVNDVNLECNDEGIHLQAMDGSHVSLVCLHLKEKIFDHFRCTRPRTLGLNMAAVSKVFKLCGNDDAVVIRHEDDGETVSLVFEGSGEDRISDFELRLMQIDQEHLGVPESDFQAMVKMPSREFQKICSDLSQFSDSVTIEVTPKNIKFSAKGEMGRGNIVLKPGAAGEVPIEVRCEGASVSLLFAVRYLSYFTKAATLSNQVKLSMSPSQPLEVTYTLNNEDEFGHLKFYLAPKMTDEEEEQEESAAT